MKCRIVREGVAIPPLLSADVATLATPFSKASVPFFPRAFRRRCDTREMNWGGFLRLSRSPFFADYERSGLLFLDLG